MSLLPACYIPMQYEKRCNGSRREGRAHMMEEKDTVVLRLAEGGFLVAQLDVYCRDQDDGSTKAYSRSKINAELCVIGGGCDGDWDLMEEVPITFNGELASGSKATELMKEWETDAVIPVGHRDLCLACSCGLCDAPLCAAARGASGPHLEG